MSVPLSLDASYLENLMRLADDSETADYLIACCGDEYKVHKQVVGLHSDYFAPLFKSQYKIGKLFGHLLLLQSTHGTVQENTTQRIDLVDDPKLAVKCMIEYFYKFDYEHDEREIQAPDFDTRPIADFMAINPSRSPDAPLQSILQGHAEIYNLADKYDIPGLRFRAQKKFEREAEYLVCTSELECRMSQLTPELYAFLSVIPYGYTHTAPNENGLRESIVSAWRLAADLISTTLGDDNLRELIDRFPDLAVDLIKSMKKDTNMSVRNGLDWRRRNLSSDYLCEDLWGLDDNPTQLDHPHQRLEHASITRAQDPAAPGPCLWSEGTIPARRARILWLLHHPPLP